jgi:hypothetical protein
MKEVNALLKQENEYLEEKAKLAMEYYKEDVESLNKATNDALTKAGYTGFTFTLDENGNITDYTSKMEGIYAVYSKMVDDWNAKYEGQEESDEATAAQEKIDELEELIGDINDCKDAIKEDWDTYDEMMDSEAENLRTILQNNYDMLVEALEFSEQINENQLSLLEFYYNQIADNVYKAAEAFGVLQKELANSETALGTYSAYYNKLLTKHNAGELTDADYIDGL